MKKEVLIPKETFNKIENLNTKLEKEFLYYLIYLISISKERDCLELPGFVSISSKFLQRKKHDYQKYINFLENNNLIKIIHKYKIGKRNSKGKTKLYKLLLDTEKQPGAGARLYLVTHCNIV